MSQHPDPPQGANQETQTPEASADQRTPQTSVGRPSAVASGEGGSPPSRTASGQSPEQKQEFYWRRQAEKLEKELASLRAEREGELARLSRDRDEAAARATEAEWRARRLSLISEARLPSELADLVPEGPPETVTDYLEKLKPIAEKLARPTPRGLTVTNPPNPAGQDEARLSRLAAEAARGDRRALREYAHLREKVKPNPQSH